VDLDPLQRVVAESEIRNLVAHLGHLADDGDITEYLSFFVEDGLWGLEGQQPRVGLEDIRAGVEQRRKDLVQGPGAGTRHLNTTLSITIDGPDSAHAESYVLFVGTKGTDHPEIVFTGRYLDEFRRTPDGWKMVSRHIVPDVN
jgi:ketosteroid isomerase-like protein